MGLLGLVIALISRSRAARLAALAIVFVSALSAWPVYEKGQAGYDREDASTAPSPTAEDGLQHEQ